MSLLDFFKRPQATDVASPDGDAAVVLRARAHARRRLIGAAVLLTLGVLGFPLLFETRPRPIPVDIPIELPAKDSAGAASARPRAAGPVVMEPAPAATPVAPAVSQVAAPVPPPASQPVQGSAAKPNPATAAASSAVVALAAPVAKPSATPATPASANSPKPAAVAAAGAAAQPGVAAAAPTPASAAANARYVVQVGAFADADAARAARLRVEKLGLKTFTQEIQKDGALRIRVRVGPYPTKSEAEKAAKTIQKGDLPAAVLLL
jgi:DedD protein